jgi:hypothetical protein
MSKLTVVGIREFLASRASNDADSTVRDLTQMLAGYVEPEEPKAVEPVAKKESSARRGLRRKVD